MRVSWYEVLRQTNCRRNIVIFGVHVEEKDEPKKTDTKKAAKNVRIFIYSIDFTENEFQIWEKFKKRFCEASSFFNQVEKSRSQKKKQNIQSFGIISSVLEKIFFCFSVLGILNTKA